MPSVPFCAPPDRVTTFRPATLAALCIVAATSVRRLPSATGRQPYMSYRPAALSVPSRDTHTMILSGETHIAVHIYDSNEGQRRD
jgi:hypothetical protein